MNATREDIADPAVVHEDARLLVVAKPAGELTQPGAPRKRRGKAQANSNSTTDRVSRWLGTTAKVVHRLDAPVSGLVVFGKDDETTAWLSQCLQQRTIRRGYLAIVRSADVPDTETIAESLRKTTSKDGARGGPLMQVHPTGKKARTSVVKLAEDRAAGLALVGVRLHTGRTHQARAHLAWGIGAIVGDRRYGDIASGPRIGLHAALLMIPARKGSDAIAVSQDPPEDFWQLAPTSGFAAMDWKTPLRTLLQA